MRQRRDTSAFSEFVGNRSHALLRTAYLVAGDHQLAQDLLQEALVKTFMAWPRLRDPERAEAYTRRAIVTTAIDWRRRRSFHERPVEVKPDASGTGEEDGVVTHEVLVAHLRGLPPRQRAAIVLRFYEDLSVTQTAEIMGCSPGSVKSHVSIGLAKLRGRLGPAVDLVPTGDEGMTS